jgi:hypothetical protein
LQPIPSGFIRSSDMTFNCSMGADVMHSITQFKPFANLSSAAIAAGRKTRQILCEGVETDYASRRTRALQLCSGHLFDGPEGHQLPLKRRFRSAARRSPRRHRRSTACPFRSNRPLAVRQPD